MDQQSLGSGSLASANSPQKSILHRPVDTVRDVLQRISSHEAIPRLDRSRSHVAFHQDPELETHLVQLIDEEEEENGDTLGKDLTRRRRRRSVSIDASQEVRRGSDDTCNSQEEEKLSSRGISNPGFGLPENDEGQDEDHLPPLRRDSRNGPRFQVENETKPHTFQIGPAIGVSESDVNLHTKDPHKMHRSHAIMDTIRRIGSRENVRAVFHRNHSHVSFHDPKDVIQDHARKITRQGSRPFDQQDVEVYRREISSRASQLKLCASHPAFERLIQSFDEDNEDSEPKVEPMDNDTRMWKAYIVPFSSPQKFSVKQRNASQGFGPNEPLPVVENYAVESGAKVRPTLDDLRREQGMAEEELVRNTGNEASFDRAKLGWIQGVVLWTIQDLWAVQLFLRLPWLAAQAGIGLYTVIVLVSTAIALLTSLSTSAIATNGEIGIGGTYFMIARSLGPAFGAAIGVIFTLANVINISLNLQGFADIVVILLNEHGQRMIDHVNDTRIIGVIALVALTLFTLAGMVIASRVKTVCMIVIIVGISAVIIGSIVPPNLQEQAAGFVGYSSSLFRENFVPYFQRDKFGDQNFLTCFAVFFPSISGILAGTSITGDLRDPSGAIPKGTFVATIISATVYLVLGWVSAAVVLRNASGKVENLIAGNLTACARDITCKEGLLGNMEIMGIISHFRPLIIAATFAATISTSIGCIHFAPKVFQALCRDKIFPGTAIFGKGFGHHDEPYPAYLLSMLVAVAFLMPSDLNFISNIVCNCFLMTYALVNYATFNSSYSKSPGWRPTFRYYNQWLSLFTCAACLAFMFALDWMSAIIVFLLSVVLWLYVFYKKPDVNWGTSGEANVYRSALSDNLRLLKVQTHVKNYRPQILVLTGLPFVRPSLVYMANSITRSTGLVICGHVMVGEPIRERTVLEQEVYQWFRRRKIRAFYEYIAADSTLFGVKALLQTAGMGKMKPNILMMGYHLNWVQWNPVSMKEYVQVIHDAFDANRAVIIFCAREGFDISEVVNFEKICGDNAAASLDTDGKDEPESEPENRAAIPLEVNPTDNPELKARIEMAERFEPGRKKKCAGEVHVWWLYDDGGLTLLVPHLMRRKTPWKGSKLKVFCQTGKDGNAEETKNSMEALLNKFRIKVDDIIPVDLSIAPSTDAISSFNSVIEAQRMQAGHVNDPHYVIGDMDCFDYGDRTIKQIRLRELLLENSAAASLNVITMPLPKRGRSRALYMAVLASMSAGLPPTLLVRGNQENVLTFHC